jgi:hypothetical protein
MTTSKETWIELFGHEPNKEMKTLVLEEVRNSGADIREVISRYVLPDMAILGEDSKFEYQGRRVTVAEYREVAPLGPYAKLIIVRNEL